MRKRLGALHSDTLEEFIQLAQQSWQQELVFYEGLGKGHTTVDYEEQDTNTTSIEQEDTVEYSNINIMIIDTQNKINEVFEFCDQNRTYQTKYLEYCSRCERTDTKEVHFHFWITTMSSVKYSDLIDVYLKRADCYIYAYDKSKEEEFQKFIEKMKFLNQNTVKPIIKVANSMRVSSQQIIQQEEQIMTIKTLPEALRRVRDKYF